MKILYLTNIPAPYRVDFFQELGKYCDLTVLYELDEAKDRDKDWKRIEKKRTYQEIFLNAVIKLTSSAWCPGVVRYLRDRSYNIIVVGGYSTPTGLYSIQYLKRHQIPYILNCDGGFIREGEAFVKKKIKTYFISDAEAYLSTGKECDKYLSYYGAIDKKIYHYPFTSLYKDKILKSPVSEDRKQTLRKMLAIKEKKIILSVGSFIFRKGFDLLLSAARMLDRAYGLYIIGGSETEEYRLIKEQHNLTNVHFISFLTADRLQNYFWAADIFVLPTREDIWGLVINEAMASALPVITTDRCVAGLELIHDCGKIIPSENIQILFEAIKEYLEDDDLRAEAAKRSLQKIQEYTIENMAQVHLNIFEEVLNAEAGKQRK